MSEKEKPIYQVFIRNFTAQGTFAAAIPRLADIAALGFGWLYLTPIHPIGRMGRKGSLGSPYAISDYRAIDASLGTEEDFRAFLRAAHSLGLKVMIDVVFNHCSPDSVLAREHPEWFMLEGQAPAALRGELQKPAAGAALGRKCAEWSDIVDFDYSSSPQLWIELISVLSAWRDAGVDGFRCDVASLVPVEFWKQARQRVNQYDPGARRELYPLVWLAESVQPAFLKKMRDAGFKAWADPELHGVFDLSYDHDGWERLEEVWAGRRPAAWYLDYLYAQETLYPAGACKMRFLENHDRERAAGRFRGRAELEAWTLFYQFLPGSALCYMGQEYAIARKPDLFEKNPVDWSSGDASFRDYFARVLSACAKAKKEAPRFAWEEAGEGLYLLWRSEAESDAGTPVERSARPRLPARRFVALVRLGAGAGPATLRQTLKGRDLLSGAMVSVEKGGPAPERPLLVEIETA